MSSKSAHIEKILGYDIYARDVDCLGDEILTALRHGYGPKWLACFNPHSYISAEDCGEFKDSLQAADWLVADGVGTVVASRVLGGSLRRRITGSDVFETVMRLLNDSGHGRVFFLGSTSENLAAIVKRVSSDFPKITVAGTYSPPFKDAFDEDDTTAMVRAVTRAQADILWVGMTAPKQELWLHRNLSQIEGVRFAAAIGAVFDFYSGNVQRSPVVFQKVGLEWLPRLARQPRRLWRRTFLSGPRFLKHVLSARLTDQ